MKRKNRIFHPFFQNCLEQIATKTADEAPKVREKNAWEIELKKSKFSPLMAHMSWPRNRIYRYPQAKPALRKIDRPACLSYIPNPKTDSFTKIVDANWNLKSMSKEKHFCYPLSKWRQAKGETKRMMLNIKWAKCRIEDCQTSL